MGNIELIQLPSGVIERKRYVANQIQISRSNGTSDTKYLYKGHLGSVDTQLRKDIVQLGLKLPEVPDPEQLSPEELTKLYHNHEPRAFDWQYHHSDKDNDDELKTLMDLLHMAADQTNILEIL